SLLISRFFFSSRRRHTRFSRDWSSDVCSSDLVAVTTQLECHNYHAYHCVLIQCVEIFLTGDWDLIALDSNRLTYNSPVLVHKARSEERRVGKESRYRWQP